MTTQNFKPTLFSTEMVQAILDGRKTQTRIVIKTQPNKNDDVFPVLKPDWDGKQDYPSTLFYFDKNTKRKHPNYKFVLPKYQKGDTLWVRETCSIDFYNIGYIYKASVSTERFERCKGYWMSPTGMPKEAARIFLEVTDVRVERLQDISEEDAIAEGVEIVGEFMGRKFFKLYGEISVGQFNTEIPVKSFQSLWQKINAKKHPWESNPWVWVYTFKRIEKPENF